MPRSTHSLQRSAHRLLEYTRVFFAVGVVIVAASTILADDSTGRTQLGISTLASQSATSIDNVNLQNGNVSMQLPLASLPAPPGGKLNYTLYAYYNSQNWESHAQELQGEQDDPENPCIPTYVQRNVSLRDDAGWHIGGRYQIIFLDAHEDFDYQPATDNGSCFGNEYYYMAGAYFRPVLKFPDGSEHEMRIYGSFTTYPGNHDFLKNFYKSQTGNLTNPFTSAVRMYTVDGTYITVDYTSPSSYSIYMKDGTAITPSSDGQRTTDPNGNSIDVGTSGGYDFVKDEATAREIRWSSSTYGTDPATKVEYQSVGGDWQSVYVVWGTTTVQGIYYFHKDWNESTFSTTHTCLDTAVVSDSINVVRKIVLPATESGVDPQQFQFAYNSDSSYSATDTGVLWSCSDTSHSETRTASSGLGEISQVTLPSGATINYAYSQDGVHKVFATDETGSDWIVANSLGTRSITHDGITDTWTYSIDGPHSHIAGSVTNPDGSTHVETTYNTDTVHPPVSDAAGQAGLTWRTVDSNHVLTERHWTLLGGTGLQTFGSSTGNVVTFNPVVDTEYTTLLDTDGTTRLAMTAKSFTYDYNGDLTSTTEYDWIDLASVTFAGGTGMPTGIPSGTAVLRVTNNSYYNTASSSSSSTAYGSRTLSGSTLILGKPEEITVGTSSTVKSDTKFSYDGNSYGTAPSVGNLTNTSVYNDTASAWINTTATYDSHGNVTETRDGNNIPTVITYGSVGGYTGLYPTQVVQAYGTSVARTFQTGYDFYTGLPTSVTDADNSVTTTTAYDILLRPTLITNASGITSFENKVETDYYDHDRYVVTKADLANDGDGKKVRVKYFDQLGRVRLTRTLEDASTQVPADKCDGTTNCYGIKVETRYASASGYTYQVTSNPYRASASTSETASTMGWTRTKAWATGRESQVETFSGASLPAPWESNSSSTGVVDTSIASNATTVTDQGSKVRRSLTDSLGRLVRVDEPTSSGLGTVSSPNQYTGYTYDVLNNLTGVSQGSQIRSFSYNSLARLTSATNPESGTISYGYDSNGNLTSKTDARSITTSYTFDALNRVTQRSYNDSVTPTVTYTYDNKTNAYGKLTKVSNSNSTTEYTSFDVLGRITGHKQTTASTDYTTAYTYNLAGELLTETYPSGRMVQNTFASNGDLSQVETKPSGGSYSTRASNFVYNAAGAVQSVELGNGKYESTAFNSRLQPTQIGLGTSTTDTSLLKLEYSYGTTSNNGNVLSQTITVPGVSYPFVQSYSYDELNRLSSATETYNSSQNWKQEFSYDRYGNRSFVTGSGHTDTLGSCTMMCNPTFSSTTNRITSSGYTFDSDGNVTADPSGRTFVYDGESKQTSVSNGSTLGTYYFDGDGKRVKKTSASDSTIFVYDVAGVLVEEFPTSSPTTISAAYTYAREQLLSTETTSSTEYSTSDAVDSPRISTNGSGSVIARHDYMPFGEEISTPQRTTGIGYTADSLRQQFTSYQNDTETNLDYAKARIYARPLGRFLRPDPFIGSAVTIDPQTWNRYTYVLNSPLMFTDPWGLVWGHNMKTGDVVWYKTQDDLDAAGDDWEKFEPPDWTYYAGNGQYVALNPDGPGSCKSGYDCSNDYFTSGWTYTSDPKTAIKDGGVEDVSLDFYMGIFGGYSVLKSAGKGAIEGIISQVGKQTAKQTAKVAAEQTGFKVEGQLAKIFGDRRLFMNWLKGNQSLSRMGSPLNSTEVQQLLDNAKELGMDSLVEANKKGLLGEEITGQWRGIAHFKIGNVHIPVDQTGAQLLLDVFH